MARSRTGIFYVIDVVRIQGSPLDVEQLKAQTAKTDAELTARRAAILLQQEPGAAGKSFIDAQVRGPLCGYYVQVENPTGDKYTRALPMSSAAQAGNLKLVRGRWNRDFVEELEQAGPDPKLYDHDDQWDAGASAFNHLAAHQSEFGWNSVRELDLFDVQVLFDPLSLKTSKTIRLFTGAYDPSGEGPKRAAVFLVGDRDRRILGQNYVRRRTPGQAPY